MFQETTYVEYFRGAYLLAAGVDVLVMVLGPDDLARAAIYGAVACLGVILVAHLLWALLLSSMYKQEFEQRSSAKAWEMFREHMRERYGEDWHEHDEEHHELLQICRDQDAALRDLTARYDEVTSTSLC